MKFLTSFRPRRPLVPLALVVIVALWAVDPIPSPPVSLAEQIGNKGRLVGIVQDNPTEGRGGTRLSVHLKGAKDPLAVLLTFEPPADPETPPPAYSLKSGDVIQWDGKLKRPNWYKNPGGFNYRQHLERKGIFLVSFVQRADWQILAQGKSPWLSSLRQRFLREIDRETSTTTRPFLKAILLNDRSELTPSFWQEFQRTGTSHLVAISGQHVGLVAAPAFLLIFWLLKRSVTLMLLVSVSKWAVGLSLLPATGYVLLAGAPPSAIRALILLTFVALTPWARRTFDIYSALAFAAILILLLEPSSLWSASFQLSFVAVLSLALLTTPLLRLCHVDPSRSPRWKQGLIGLPLATLAATAGTAPLAAYLFHTFSLTGLLANLWAIPYAGLILTVGLLSLVATPLGPIGKSGLHFTSGLSEQFLGLIHSQAKWPFTLETYPTEKELILLYSLLLVIILTLHRKIKMRLGLMLFLLIGLGFFPSPSRARNLQVTFLDIGQGDATLLKTPEGKTILIDGGGFLIPGLTNRFDVGKEVLVPYLKREGIQKIDLMILSHPHPDHYGGLQAVLDSFPVVKFWWNGQSFPDESFAKLLQAVKEKSHPQIVSAPQVTDWDRLRLEVIYPKSLNPTLDINDNCLVIRIIFGETSFFFAGDIERFAEEKIVEQNSKLSSTVLKIPHHGSRSSSSVPFIEKVSPRFAVVSLAEGNMFGFPSEGVLEKYEHRGIQLFRTDRHGATTFYSDGKKVWVKTFLPH